MASVLWRQCSVNFSNILPTGCSFSSWTASIWVSYGVQSSQRLPASARTSLRVMAFFGCNRLLWCGVLHRIQVGICSTVNLHGLQGLSLPSQHRLRENLCSVPLPATPLPHCLCCPCGCSTPIPPLSIIKKKLSRRFCLWNMLLLRCFHHCWLAEPWPEVGLTLKLVLLQEGSGRSHFCSSLPHYQSPVTHKPTTTVVKYVISM